MIISGNVLQLVVSSKIGMGQYVGVLELDQSRCSLNLGVWVESKMSERMSDHVSEMPEISHHEWKNE